MPMNPAASAGRHRAIRDSVLRTGAKKRHHYYLLSKRFCMPPGGEQGMWLIELVSIFSRGLSSLPILVHRTKVSVQQSGMPVP